MKKYYARGYGNLPRRAVKHQPPRRQERQAEIDIRKKLKNLLIKFPNFLHVLGGLCALVVLAINSSRELLKLMNTDTPDNIAAKLIASLLPEVISYPWNQCSSVANSFRLQQASRRQWAIGNLPTRSLPQRF